MHCATLLPPAPTPPPNHSSALRFALAVLACLAAMFVAAHLQGCAAPLDGAKRAVGAVSDTYAALEPPLEKRREAEGRECIFRPAPADAQCLAEVRARWAPVRAASERLYSAIVAAVSAVHAWEAAEALGRDPDAATALRAIDAALGALDAFRRAADPEHDPSALRAGGALTPGGAITPGGAR